MSVSLGQLSTRQRDFVMVIHLARQRDDGYTVFEHARTNPNHQPGENFSVAEKSHFSARGVDLRANSPKFKKKAPPVPEVPTGPVPTLRL